MFVNQTYELVWKENILKQAKNQEIMTKARANVNLIQAADAAIEACDTVRNQNVQLCEIGKENDSDNNDDKYINLNSCNKLDVLVALMKTRDKGKSNIADKNKQVTQEHIE